MSLSALLMAPGAKGIDTELDALFKSATPKAPPASIISIPGSSTGAQKKRKVQPEAADAATSSSIKRPKIKKAQSHATPISKKSHKLRAGKSKSKADTESEDDNPELEDAYLGLTHVGKVSEDEVGSDDDEVVPPYIHESMQKKKRTPSQPKSKYVPTDETSDLRDQRTIFIGNLSVEVARKRPLLKQLQRHIISLVPTAKIESTRFRSIPFQAPTSKLPASDDEDATSKGKSTSTTPKQARAHDQERVSSWRTRQPTEAADKDAGTSDAKKFLNPNQKKKIAFINHEFHSTADSVNAYMVFAHPVPDTVSERPSNVPPPPPTLDPYAAAKTAVEKCNGTMFMDRIMRVDAIGKKHPGLLSHVPGGNATVAIDGDPKLSIFVGNLDFASKEEDLRVFFEGIISAERGPPSPGDESDGDERTAGPEKRKTWVTRVRIVRDKETQLGKGFGYIQFADRECVDEVLAIEEGKLKFAKRKLRVQRCKTLPGASSAVTQKLLTTPTPATKSRPPPTPIVIPKGDPNLGAKLAHLPKEERKQVKSADADRIARRLAKKKARGALENKGVKVLGKERERVRKVSAKRGAGGSSGKKQEGKGGRGGRGRIRSEKSVATRNAKK